MSFSESIVNAVWEKARIVEGYDKRLYRKDACGAWIAKKDYGDRKSIYGWEVDHIFPENKGGDNDLRNLRPLHYMNNASKGDDYPAYTAKVISDGNRNIMTEKRLRVNENTQNILKGLYNL